MLQTVARLITVALVEPARFPRGFCISDMYDGVRMPRFGPQMAAWLKRLGYKVRVFSEEVVRLNPGTLAKFDVVCISALANTAPRSLVLAAELRRLGTTVVMGGYHFAHTQTNADTLAPTEQALRFCPYVVRGEGYIALPALLEAIKTGSGFEEVGGLSWRSSDGAAQHNPMGDKLTRDEYADLPEPDWSAVEGVKKLRVLPVQGVSGCPRDCSWCAVWPRDGHGKNRVDAARVVDGIEKTLKEFPNFKHVFFSSDNFPVNLGWAKAVCEEIIERKLSFSWTCQGEAPILVTHPELVELMARAGCKRLAMGIETISQVSLDATSKGRQNKESIETAIRICHDNGIAIHGMFIVGLPGGTAEGVVETREWAEAQWIESVQFLCLSDLPGSNDYEAHSLWNESFRPFTEALEPLNWLFINGHHARLANETMSLLEVQMAQVKAMTAFNRWKMVLEPFTAFNKPVYEAGEKYGGGGWWNTAKYYAFHQTVTALFRYRGHASTWKGWRHPLTQCYLELLTATPGSEQYNNACYELLRLLPPGWVETFEAYAAN